MNVDSAVIAGAAISAMGLAWLLYWFSASRDVKTSVRRESRASRLTHVLPLAFGIWLIAGNARVGGWFNAQLWPRSAVLDYLCVVIAAAGFGFTVWARVHLGRNWSATVTLKQDHELIRTGPYGIVRHPIYTGLLSAILGAAILRDRWSAVIAFAICVLAIVRKLRIEERLMRSTFGEKYVAYMRDVPMLVPFLP